jgi:hypothetical protein
MQYKRSATGVADASSGLRGPIRAFIDGRNGNGRKPGNLEQSAGGEMTQDARTTESESRDNGAIRQIMQEIKGLTVPDRATVALGLIGHLATFMNSRQMEKLLSQLAEEAAKVQDVPPSRHAGESAADRKAAGAGSPAVGQDGRGAVTEERAEIL